jgi:hypothetical protein
MVAGSGTVRILHEPMWHSRPRLWLFRGESSTGEGAGAT